LHLGARGDLSLVRRSLLLPRFLALAARAVTGGTPTRGVHNPQRNRGAERCVDCSVALVRRPAIGYEERVVVFVCGPSLHAVVIPYLVTGFSPGNFDVFKRPHITW